MLRQGALALRGRMLEVRVVSGESQFSSSSPPECQFSSSSPLECQFGDTTPIECQLLYHRLAAPHHGQSLQGELCTEVRRVRVN